MMDGCHVLHCLVVQCCWIMLLCNHKSMSLIKEMQFTIYVMVFWVDLIGWACNCSFVWLWSWALSCGLIFSLDEAMKMEGGELFDRGGLKFNSIMRDTWSCNGVSLVSFLGQQINITKLYPVSKSCKIGCTKRGRSTKELKFKRRPIKTRVIQAMQNR